MCAAIPLNSADHFKESNWQGLYNPDNRIGLSLYLVRSNSWVKRKDSLDNSMHLVHNSFISVS